MTTPEDVVQRQLDAYNAGDIDAFAATHDPAVVVRSGAGEVHCRDREDLRDHYGRLFASVPGLRAEVQQRICVGCWVIDAERVTAPSGEQLQAVAVYRVEDGRIREVLLLDP